MIQVHDTFVCKPGNASKLAKLFKEWFDAKGFKGAVLTDVSGQWHRVIMVSQFESLAKWEEMLKDMAKEETDPKLKELNAKFANMNEMYVSGSREFFKVW